MTRRPLAVLVLLAACHAGPRTADKPGDSAPRLPNGLTLDPAGTVKPIGQMPLTMVVAPDGRRMVLLLSGYREQGVQVVDLAGNVTQQIPQAAAFVGLAFSPDGRTLYASGGNQDVVYRYAWEADSARLIDSLVLRAKPRDHSGTSYPAGIAVSPRGDKLYVAENLADSLAVIDLASGRVIQRLATSRYPYAVLAGNDGTVYVSCWNGGGVGVFRASGDALASVTTWPAGRHPSAMLKSHDGSRLYVTSASTDVVSAIDTRTGNTVERLHDPPPGVNEGSTPNALALTADDRRLFVAEADANAVAVFDVGSGDSTLQGRIPVGWYPTSLAVIGDSLYVGNGKGSGTAPNPRGRQPGISAATRGIGRAEAVRQYTLGQYTGTLSIVGVAAANADLARMTERVTRANGWTGPGGARNYPPFEHVIYVMKENRTYDQVLGDLPNGDGDTSLLFFGRGNTPNQHALAERFGIFDRFFVNAEVSGDGHNWSMAAYASDYTQKTVPSQYSSRGRTYDYEGENRDTVPEDDVASPGAGYLWDLAARARISFRNYGMFAREYTMAGRKVYRGTKPYLDSNTNHDYPYFDMQIPDQARVDVWLEEFHRYEQSGDLPKLTLLYLPRDHTNGAGAGSVTPKSMVADNDLALGRVIQALSASRYWRNTVVFVLEDDAQDGPDHVDSHRSPLLVISAWNRGGVIHRFANTTDVVETIEEILGLDHLSQFDDYGRPLRDIWNSRPDLTTYAALTPSQRMDEPNPPRTRAAVESRKLDLSDADRADMDQFNRVLWLAIKGDDVPYPGPTHLARQPLMSIWGLPERP